MGVLLGPYDADFAGRQMAFSRTDLAHSRRIDLQEWRGSARRALSGHGSSGAGSAVALLSLGRAGRVSQPRFTVHDIAFRARLFSLARRNAEAGWISLLEEPHALVGGCEAFAARSR